MTLKLVREFKQKFITGVSKGVVNNKTLRQTNNNNNNEQIQNGLRSDKNDTGILTSNSMELYHMQMEHHTKTSSKNVHLIETNDVSTSDDTSEESSNQEEETNDDLEHRTQGLNKYNDFLPANSVEIFYNNHKEHYIKPENKPLKTKGVKVADTKKPQSSSAILHSENTTAALMSKNNNVSDNNTNTNNDNDNNNNIHKKVVTFDIAYVTWTYTKYQYERKGNIGPSKGNLNYEQLKNELDDFKEYEMSIHPDSAKYTLIYKYNSKRRSEYESKKQDFFQRQEVENIMYRRRLMDYIRELFSGKIKNENLYHYLLSVQDSKEPIDTGLFPVVNNMVYGPELYNDLLLEKKTMIKSKNQITCDKFDLISNFGIPSVYTNHQYPNFHSISESDFLTV